MKSEAITFVHVSYIATTPEKLWQALTSPEFTEQYWFGFRIESDWKVGSKLLVRAPARLKEIKNGGIHGEVLAYDKPKRLAYTFGQANDAPEKRSRVTFELKPFGSVVKLSVTHTGLTPADLGGAQDTLRGVDNGWPAILSGLKSLLETGKAPDMEMLVRATFPSV